MKWSDKRIEYDTSFVKRQSLCRAHDEFGYCIDHPNHETSGQPCSCRNANHYLCLSLRGHRGEKCTLTSHIFVTPGVQLQWAGRILQTRNHRFSWFQQRSFRKVQVWEESGFLFSIVLKLKKENLGLLWSRNHQ